MRARVLLAANKTYRRAAEAVALPHSTWPWRAWQLGAMFGCRQTLSAIVEIGVVIENKYLSIALGRTGRNGIRNKVIIIHRRQRNRSSKWRAGEMRHGGRENVCRRSVFMLAEAVLRRLAARQLPRRHRQHGGIGDEQHRGW